MSAEGIVKRLMAEVPKIVAAGVVEMEMGMLLAAKTIDSHPQEVIDLIAAATKDMFEGDNVRTIEGIFNRVRGIPQSTEHLFQEIIVNSKNLTHYFCRLEANNRVVICAVCPIDVNIGMVFAKARAIARTEDI